MDRSLAENRYARITKDRTIISVSFHGKFGLFREGGLVHKYKDRFITWNNKACHSRCLRLKVGRRLPQTWVYYYQRNARRQLASALNQLFAFNVDQYYCNACSTYKTCVFSCSIVSPVYIIHTLYISCSYLPWIFHTTMYNTCTIHDTYTSRGEILGQKGRWL